MQGIFTDSALTWVGQSAILEARAVPRLHVCGEACPDNAAGWGNRGGLTGSSLEQDGPPQEAPTYQAMCVSFYPRRSGFSAFEQGSEIRLHSRASLCRSYGGKRLASRRGLRRVA